MCGYHCIDLELYILRVSDQNGVSLLYIMHEIHHSGREPLICKCGYHSGNTELCVSVAIMD